MTRKYLPLILLLIISVSCDSGRHGNVPPKVENGVLDLRGWRFEKDETIKLDGDWEFYWKQLFSAKDATNGGQQPVQNGYIELPGVWNDLKLNGKSLPAQGYATLRLTIVHHGPPLDLSLKLNDVYSAYVVYVDGQKRGSVGRVSDNKEGYFDQNVARLIDFTTGKEKTEIVFQISNYSMLYGGSPQVIQLGNRHTIHKKRDMNLAYDLIIMGSIMMMGLYHLSIFLLRKKNRSALFFSICCICNAIYNSMVGEIFLTILFPDLSITSTWKLLVICISMGIGFLYLFLASLFPDEFPGRLVKIVFGLLLLITIFVPFSSPVIVSACHIIAQIIIVFVVSSSLWFVTRAVIKKRNGAMVVLISFFLLFFVAINDILFFHAVIETTYLVSVGLFAYVFSQAFLISQRFNIAFVEAENLSNELEEKNERLLELDKLKDDFLAKTSHELSTPLHGIIGITESLIDRYRRSISADFNSDLNLIVSNASRLSVLINDILDFSKLKHKDIKLLKKPVDIKSLSELALVLLKPMVGQKQLILENNIGRDLPVIYADENRVQQILLNLIGNAVKFTAEGFVNINARETNGFIEVQIRDSGVGIPQNRLDEVFVSFHQVESSHSRRFGGTGLGLSITKHLVEQHGGSISIDSQIDQGTTVTFTLPKLSPSDMEQLHPYEEPVETSAIGQMKYLSTDLREDLAADMETETENSSCPVEKNYPYPTILVVDDEPVNLKILKSQLATVGYNVIPAQNGMQALEILEDRSVNLVLLDVMMPMMNGFEVCEKIREYDDLSSLPIIMLTALNQFESMIKGLQSGANDYLTKPFNRDELLARIRIHLTIQENEELKKNIAIYRKIESDLNVLKMQITQVIDHINANILLVDKEQKISFSNQTARQFLGFLPHELEGQGLATVFTEEDVRQLIDSFVQPLAENGFPRKIKRFHNITVKVKNGEKMKTDVSISEFGINRDIGYAMIIDPTMQSRVIDEQSYRKALVQVMVESLTVWETVTRKTKIELAEESKIWRVHINEGRLRTKTMDRYLSIKKLPRYPRWKDVVGTARFVMDLSSVPDSLSSRLNQRLKNLLELVHYHQV